MCPKWKVCFIENQCRYLNSSLIHQYTFSGEVKGEPNSIHQIYYMNMCDIRSTYICWDFYWTFCDIRKTILRKNRHINLDDVYLNSLFYISSIQKLDDMRNVINIKKIFDNCLKSIHSYLQLLKVSVRPFCTYGSKI